MSLKRILGTVLATRMAGRGRRGGALGTAAMLGGLGRRRRSGLGGKAGLAALGYMAYRAYQDHQSRAGGQSQTRAGGYGQGQATMRTGSGAGAQGGFMAKVQDLANRVTGNTALEPSDHVAGSDVDADELRENERAAEDLGDETALLLIQAMITAAYSDGALSSVERARIMGEIEQGDADADDRQVMEREFANPKPLEELLAQVNDPETAEAFYLASRAAIDGGTDANRAYLAELRQRLDLSEQQVAEIDEMVS